jgi:hypothetical protein
MKVSQCDRIVQYIEENGSITQLDALREFGCMRLASRISDLKRQGVQVRRTMETSKNRYGEPICYARYTIRGVEQ